MKQHLYKSTVTWTGNKGTGTSDYRSYDRSHTISIDGKPEISGSSDAVFRGEKHKHNPEDLMVAALSGCHMLWYLHLCSDNGVIVIHYSDQATGVMDENNDGSGQFKEVTLYPKVIVKDSSMIEKANALHHDAHKMCFIARSVNFPVHHKPLATVET
ncbi:MAG TPA: OsmC family protein [Cyclobacteriaceae bacterium]|nr:OsmC family protein [Cyclobacteriaceae bacterium]